MQLSIQNRFSIAGKNDVTDELGQVVFQTEGEFGFPFRQWLVSDSSSLVVSEFKRCFAWLLACWNVFMDGEEFTVKQARIFSRDIEVIGGPFDGAVMYGSFFGQEFTLEYQGRVLAVLDRKLSFSDRAEINVSTVDSKELVFAVTMMSILQARRKEASDEDK